MACAQVPALSETDIGMCAICVRTLSDPRVLSCLHLFCRACIDELVVTAKQRCVNCPACRAKTTLSVRGAASLPKYLTKKSDRCRWCCGCEQEGEDAVPPTALCGECSEAFCTSHALSHHFTSGHAVTPWAKNGASSLGSEFLSSRPRLCSDHDEPLKYFCRQCVLMVCGGCAVVGSHCGHAPIVRAKDVEKERKQELFQKVDKLRRKVVPRKEKTLKAVKEVQNNLTRNADVARAAVQSSGERVVNTVKAFVQQQLQDIDDTEVAQCKVLDEQEDELKRDIDAMKTAIEFSDMITRISTSGPDQSMSSVFQALEKRVASFMIGDEEEKPRSHALLRFEAGIDEDALLLEAGRTVGTVSFREISADHCVVSGKSSVTCSPGEAVAFLVEARDAQDKLVTPSREEKLVTKCTKLPNLEEGSLAIGIEKQDDGLISVSWVCPVTGEYVVEMTINGEKLPVTLSAQARLMFDRNVCQPELVLSEDRMTVVHTANQRWSSIVGSSVMKHGCHTWAVSVDNPTKKMTDHVIGVVARKSRGAIMCGESARCFSRHDSSFSWSNNPSYFMFGSGEGKKFSPFQNGDNLRLDLNCDRHTLTITNLCTEETATIQKLPDEEFFPYFSLYYSGSSFTLIS